MSQRKAPRNCRKGAIGNSEDVDMQLSDALVPSDNGEATAGKTGSATGLANPEPYPCAELGLAPVCRSILEFLDSSLEPLQ
jgi:hypothetical protein